MALTHPLPDAPVNFSHSLMAEKKWLSLPAKKGVTIHPVELRNSDCIITWCDIALTEDEPAWSGRSLEIRMGPPANGPDQAFRSVGFAQSDEGQPSGELYVEALRPQFHFSAIYEPKSIWPPVSA